MDSLSQALLGATIAGIAAPPEHRRKALLIGAALGTLPDLDVLIDYGDAVKNFTYHRGFSHSLFVLAPTSVFLWLTLRQFWAPVREAQLRWLAAISLALITHPILDAFTAYGTQLFWPLDVPPAAWATMFIIDPAYTLPLLIGTLSMAIWPFKAWSFSMLRTGLALSALYLGWSWIAQSTVEQNARNALASMEIRDARLFVTPTPLNTLLWRVVADTENGYLEGFDSLVVNEERISFQPIESDFKALKEADDVWAVQRLRWFSQDFIKTTVQGDELVISDLRMGQEPAYVFSHVVAIRSNPHWKAIPTEQVPLSFGDRALSKTWQRIWKEPTPSASPQVTGRK